MSRPSEYTYKSPPSKLIKLFREARDNWKQKYLESTQHNKYLKNRIHFLETSKQKYKDQVKSLQSEIHHLQQQLLESQNSASEPKKTKFFPL